MALARLREALLPRAYTDEELDVGSMVDFYFGNTSVVDDLNEEQVDHIRFFQTVHKCTAEELRAALSAGAVHSSEEFLSREDLDTAKSLLTWVMPNVDKMRVVLEHDPSAVVNKYTLGRYVEWGGRDMKALGLLLEHAPRDNGLYNKACNAAWRVDLLNTVSYTHLRAHETR